MTKCNEKEGRKLDLLAEIASMYYEQELTQNEIADRVCISRTRISRLLKEAKEKKIISVSVNYGGQRSYELENILKRRFGLKDVRVLNSRNMSDEQRIKNLGIIAADYFEKILKQQQVVGVSWGKSVNATVNELKGNKELHPDIVQIMGATIIENYIIDVPGIIRRMMDLYSGVGYYLNAPLYVEDNYVRNALKTQPLIFQTLGKAKSADIILTGIGNVSLETYNYVWKGYDIEMLLGIMQKYDAVGSVCAQAYNISGVPLENGLNERIMGISLHELQNIKTVIGVAGGFQKCNSVLGALRGKYVNVLVTDSVCATEVLNISDKQL